MAIDEHEMGVDPRQRELLGWNLRRQGVQGGNRSFACDIGPNFYATQTWANVERETDGGFRQPVCAARTFQGCPFSQEGSFPVRAQAPSTPNGRGCTAKPIRETALSPRWARELVEPRVEAGEFCRLSL